MTLPNSSHDESGISREISSPLLFLSLSPLYFRQTLFYPPTIYQVGLACQRLITLGFKGAMLRLESRTTTSRWRRAVSRWQQTGLCRSAPLLAPFPVVPSPFSLTIKGYVVLVLRGVIRSSNDVVLAVGNSLLDFFIASWQRSSRANRGAGPNPSSSSSYFGVD